MLNYNTKTFAWGHIVLSLLILVIYIQRSFQTELLVLVILSFLWSILLMVFSNKSHFSIKVRDQFLLIVIVVDILLISCVYFLPYYKNTPPLWILLSIVPFYATDFGIKATMRVSILGMISILCASFLLDPDYDLVIIILTQLIIFIYFIARKTDQLNQFAFYDGLTGLPNRTYMRNSLEFFLKSTDGARCKCFYFFLIDLDQFKEVNDTYGHDVGDLLLIGVTNRMKQVVPEHAIISRMGGDEFTVLLPIIKDEDEAQRTAEKLIHCLEMPLIINGHEMKVSMSLGISMFPNDGTDAESLMKRADIAMYEAKSAGRNRFKYFG